MSTQLFFSHRIDQLAGRLAAEVVRTLRNRSNPLQPLRVLVPNNHVKRYLQVAIADTTGVAANLSFLPLQHGLGDLLLQDQAPGVQLLHPEGFRLMLCSTLLRHMRQPTAVGKALDTLSFMLYDTTGAPCRNFAGRLWQLTGQLSHYLTEYELHRSDMVAGWSKHPPEYSFSGNNPDVADMERCQQSLYHTIFSSGGIRDELADATGIRYVTLPQLAAESTWDVAGETIFVFGLSQISAFHRNVLMSLGRTADLKLFQLNICSEFWEDVSTDREDRWRRLTSLEPDHDEEGGEELAWDEHENMLLKWWGKPGRENIRLLGELDETSGPGLTVDTIWLADDGASPPLPRTVLSTLQEQVLHRSQCLEEEGLPQDRSLQIFGAPSIFREMETIYQSILFNLQEDPDLKQTDIAVVVPDISLYKPAIHASFQRHPRRIGFNLSDANAAEESLYSQGLLGLLELAGGQFSRRHVFDLLRNPCMRAGCGINRHDLDTWVNWCDRLNIFHTFDGSDNDGDTRYTWQQGLRRLRLGRFMTAGDDRPNHPNNGTVLIPYADLESSNDRLMEQFSVTIESLHRETEPLATYHGSLSDWYHHIDRLCTRFLGIPDTHQEEESARDRLLRELRELMVYDPLLTDTPVDLAIIKEMVESCLRGIPSRHGSYLSAGINISGIKPNRPMPFKIVYIAGLGEGQFPGQADLSTLDLRTSRRRLGDVTRPEEDRFSVLETVMGCRNKLYLSYVNRDLQKDQDFYPCSIIVQLVNYLETSILHAPFAIEGMPVDGSDPLFLTDTGKSPRTDLFVNYSPGDRILAFERLNAQPDRLTADDITKVRDWLDQHKNTPLTAGELTSDEPVKYTIGPIVTQALLRDYLDNPLEASIKHGLAIYQYGDDDPDKSRMEDEPFFSDMATYRDIINGVVEQLIDRVIQTKDQPDSSMVDAILSDVYDQHYHHNSTPGGVFSAIDKGGVRQLVSDRVFGRYNQQGLADLLATFKDLEYLGAITVGNAVAAGQGLSLASPEITLPDATVITLDASLPYTWYDSGTRHLHHVYLTNDRSDHREFPRRTKLFMPFLGYTIIQAARHASAGEQTVPPCDMCTIHWSNLKGASSVTYAFTPETAFEYISELCHDLYRRPFDMLPYSVLLALAFKSGLPIPLRPGAHADAPDKGRFVRRLEREILDMIDNPWSDWYHSRLLKLLDYSVPEDAWDLANRRFALFHA